MSATSAAIPADRQPPEALPVAFGPWSAELRGEEVADIRYRGVLLLRAIRPVVRDQDWNTVTATSLDCRQASADAARSLTLSLRFTGPGEAGPVRYDGRLELRLDQDDLTVSFAGTAKAEFLRNRIGLVVLHPLADAGRPVDVHHTDGTTERSSWPVRISPHQPFRAVRGFHWRRDGVAADLVLEGDEFETEDQRNWTDASYKTYGTPLELPFPVQVTPGEPMLQRARLHAEGTPAIRTGTPAPVVRVSDEVVGAVPALSLGASPQGVDVPGWASRTTGFDSVLVELTGGVAGWAAVTRQAQAEAAALGGGLDVRVVTSDPADVPVALELLDAAPVVRLGVFDPHGHVSTPELWEALLAARTTHAPAAALVAGARSHFAELNRRHADLPTDAPALTCSITPQMHATELPHIVDSLAGQRAVARDATALAAGRPVHLGPVTLRQRFNAVATGPGALVPPPDPLQRSGFTAAWTLGSVAALTRAGVAGLCYYQVAGPGGIGDQAGLYPVGRLLARLAALRGREVLRADAPREVVAYPVRGVGGVGVLLARLGDGPVECTVERPGADPVVVGLEPWSAAEVPPA